MLDDEAERHENYFNSRIAAEPKKFMAQHISHLFHGQDACGGGRCGPLGRAEERKSKLREEINLYYECSTSHTLLPFFNNHESKLPHAMKKSMIGNVFFSCREAQRR